MLKNNPKTTIKNPDSHPKMWISYSTTGVYIGGLHSMGRLIRLQRIHCYLDAPGEFPRGSSEDNAARGSRQVKNLHPR